MRDFNIPVTTVDPVKKARRYVDNAKKTIQENEVFDEETGCYNDPKYIRTAGHLLWNAVLIILDAVFQVKTQQQPHPDNKEFLRAVGKRDRKLLDLINTAYNVTHISMGYDGNLDKNTCQSGFRLTNDIIDRCAKMLA